MSAQKPTEPRRGRKRVDKSDIPATFLPEGNPHARTAYICAIFGMIPGVGLLMGLVALGFGWLGYRAAKTTCAGKGIGHAVVSMVMGALETIANAIGLTLIASHFDWI